jgi:hypothetical protein
VILAWLRDRFNAVVAAIRELAVGFAVGLTVFVILPRVLHDIVSNALLVLLANSAA